MIEFGSVVPEREYLPYYVIPMDWYTRWQRYTGCFKSQVSDDSDDDEDANLGRNRKRKDTAQEKQKKVVLGSYPG